MTYSPQQQEGFQKISQWLLHKASELFGSFGVPFVLPQLQILFFSSIDDNRKKHLIEYYFGECGTQIFNEYHENSNKTNGFDLPRNIIQEDNDKLYTAYNEYIESSMEFSRKQIEYLTSVLSAQNISQTQNSQNTPKDIQYYINQYSENMKNLQQQFFASNASGNNNNGLPPFNFMQFSCFPAAQPTPPTSQTEKQPPFDFTKYYEQFLKQYSVMYQKYLAQFENLADFNQNKFMKQYHEWCQKAMDNMHQYQKHYSRIMNSYSQKEGSFSPQDLNSQEIYQKWFEFYNQQVQMYLSMITSSESPIASYFTTYQSEYPSLYTNFQQYISAHREESFSSKDNEQKTTTFTTTSNSISTNKQASFGNSPFGQQNPMNFEAASTNDKKDTVEIEYEYDDTEDDTKVRKVILPNRIQNMKPNNLNSNDSVEIEISDEENQDTIEIEYDYDDETSEDNKVKKVILPNKLRNMKLSDNIANDAIEVEVSSDEGELLENSTSEIEIEYEYSSDCISQKVVLPSHLHNQPEPSVNKYEEIEYDYDFESLDNEPKTISSVGKTKTQLNTTDNNVIEIEYYSSDSNDNYAVKVPEVLKNRISNAKLEDNPVDIEYEYEYDDISEPEDEKLKQTSVGFVPLSFNPSSQVSGQLTRSNSQDPGRRRHLPSPNSAMSLKKPKQQVNSDIGNKKTHGNSKMRCFKITDQDYPGNSVEFLTPVNQDLFGITNVKISSQTSAELSRASSAEVKPSSFHVDEDGQKMNFGPTSSHYILDQKSKENRAQQPHESSPSNATTGFSPNTTATNSASSISASSSAFTNAVFTSTYFKFEKAQVIFDFTNSKVDESAQKEINDRYCPVIVTLTDVFPMNFLTKERSRPECDEERKAYKESIYEFVEEKKLTLISYNEDTGILVVKADKLNYFPIIPPEI